MTEGFANPLTGGQGSLVRAQIKSPNFSISGQTGWAIMKNGNAYFFNIVAQGTVTATSFIGTDFVINSAGEFFYNGAPAAGNLFCSIASAAGIDAKGNAYGVGVNIGSQTGPHLQVDLFGNLTIYNAAGNNVGQWIVGDGSMRFYEPSGPAPGTLLATVSPVAGTDSESNAYQAGFSVYGSGANAGKTVTLQINAGGNPGLIFLSGRAEEATPANLQLDVNNIGAANEFLTVFLAGAQIATYTDYTYIDLLSPTKDGTGFAGGNLVYIDRAGGQHNLVQWGEGSVVLGPTADIPAIQPGTTLTPEAWHYVGTAGQPAFGAGWSNRGSPNVLLAFRKLASPANSVEIRGWCAVAAVADTTLFTLPAGYRLATTGGQAIFGWSVTSKAFEQFNVASTGAIACADANLTAAGNWYFYGVISLDQ